MMFLRVFTTFRFKNDPSKSQLSLLRLFLVAFSILRFRKIGKKQEAKNVLLRVSN